MLDISLQQIEAFTKERVEHVIHGRTSLVAICERNAYKVALRNPTDFNLVNMRLQKILSLQNILLDVRGIDIGTSQYTLLMLKKMEPRHSLGSLITRHKCYSHKSISDHILRISEECPNYAVDISTYLGGFKLNISRQIEWLNLQANLPYETKHQLLRNLNQFMSNCADQFYHELNFDTVVANHGDTHCGNIFIEPVYNTAPNIFILDPISTNLSHCLYPSWVESSSLVASYLLLNETRHAVKIVDDISQSKSNPEVTFFLAWAAVKTLVRVRCEVDFLIRNRHLQDQDILDWRHTCCSNFSKAIGNLNAMIENSTQPSKKPPAIKAASVPKVKQHNGPQKFDMDIMTSRILDTIENRRQEINSKANVYLAFCVALVAGSISMLSGTAEPSVYSRILFSASIFLTLLALWYFVGLIRSLPKGRRIEGESGRILFFGWLSNQTAETLSMEIKKTDEAQWTREIAMQAISLSKNVSYRYKNQKTALEFLKYAMILFGAGIFDKTLGITDFVVKHFGGLTDWLWLGLICN